MSKIVFVQSNMSSKTTPDGSTPTSQSNSYEHLKAPPQDRLEDGSALPIDEKQGIMFKEMTDAIRCVRVSPDGK